MYGSAGTYQQTANDEIVLLPMMETRTAVENMESILDVEGINGVYIGPSDLGFSYGLVPKLDRDEPEILKIYEKIVKECGKRGLYPGIHCSGADGAARAINMGFKLVTLSNESRADVDLCQDAGGADPQGFRRQGVTCSPSPRSCGERVGVRGSPTRKCYICDWLSASPLARIARAT